MSHSDVDRVRHGRRDDEGALAARIVVEQALEVRVAEGLHRWPRTSLRSSVGRSSANVPTSPSAMNLANRSRASPVIVLSIRRSRRTSRLML